MYDFTRVYELLNEPRQRPHEERERKLEACERAFRTFEELRGRVVDKAIRVEWAMAAVIQHYFCPTIMRVGDEVHMPFFALDDHRHQEFTDIVLFQETCTFGTKLKILERVVEEAGIEGPLRRLLQPVAEERNKLAHRKVGIDFHTAQVRLWCSKKRNWEDIPENFGESFQEQCNMALARIQEIGNQIENLQIHGNPKDEQEIK